MQKHPADSTNKLTTTSLVAHLARVPDPRINRNKDHDLVDILVIAVCALLCAAETFNDMEDFGKAKREWFQTFLKLRGGIPSHDTFNRVFAAVKPEHFLECFLGWTQNVREAVAQEVVALDGKALRRALNGDQSVKYVVSAWAEGNGLVLGQWKVADKSNEITAVPELLRVLELSGCIVTMDAMGCQKKIAKEIVEADADYVHEDQSRVRTGYAAENLAALRRLALNMLKREKTKKRGLRGKQLNASWDHPYLLRLLGI